MSRLAHDSKKKGLVSNRLPKNASSHWKLSCVLPGRTPIGAEENPPLSCEFSPSCIPFFFPLIAIQTMAATDDDYVEADQKRLFEMAKESPSFAKPSVDSLAKITEMVQQFLELEGHPMNALRKPSATQLLAILESKNNLWARKAQTIRDALKDSDKKAKAVLSAAKKPSASRVSEQPSRPECTQRVGAPPRDKRFQLRATGFAMRITDVLVTQFNNADCSSIMAHNAALIGLLSNILSKLVASMFGFNADDGKGCQNGVIFGTTTVYTDGLDDTRLMSEFLRQVGALLEQEAIHGVNKLSLCTFQSAFDGVRGVFLTAQLSGSLASGHDI